MNQQIKQRITQLNNGEIPDGYKKTEFGVFPCDWVTDKTYGDLFNFYGGLSKSREELGEDGYPYLHYGDLHRGSFNSVSYEQYNELPKCDVKLKGQDSFLMDDGDVAFLDASEDLEGTSRAVLIDNPANKPFVAGLHIIYGKSKDESLAKWYKQYITSSESTKKQFQKLASGFKVYGLNRDTLAKIRIAYPSSRTEQEKIAEILMKWDEAIELYGKQIEKLKQYKAICLKKIFPAKGKNVPEWRFKGFTEAWEQRKFDEVICRIGTGLNPRENFTLNTGGENYYVTIKNFEHGHLFLDDNCDKVDDKALQKIQERSDLRVNDILFTSIGRIGDCFLIKKQPENWNINESVFTLRPNQALVEPEYIYHTIHSDIVLGQILNVVTGSTFKSIKIGDLKKTDIPVPNKAEQKQIAMLISNLDTLITLHQKKVEFIIEQRKALQQYLLNGIVRV